MKREARVYRPSRDTRSCSLRMQFVSSLNAINRYIANVTWQKVASQVNGVLSWTGNLLLVFALLSKLAGLGLNEVYLGTAIFCHAALQLWLYRQHLRSKEA